MVLTSLFAALITVCAWIAVPVPPVGFTLQTLGVLLALGILGTAFLEPYLFCTDRGYHYTNTFFFLILGYMHQWKKCSEI